MKMKERKGSALLIVLGMLAFMIVSAVAFSAYMRYARLPSSYLRRTTASRELTKAALARAIDEIDFAVANNPYPGLGVYDARSGGDRQGEQGLRRLASRVLEAFPRRRPGGSRAVPPG